MRVLREREGWLWAQEWMDATVSVDEAASAVSEAVGEPAIGGWVFDSDFGYLVGTDEDGERAFQFAVNAPYDDADEGDLALAEMWRDPDQRRRAAEELGDWSRGAAPQPITADAVLAGMPGHGVTEPPPDDAFFASYDELWILAGDDEPEDRWVLAEDGVRFLYRSLGFGSIDSAAWYDPESPDD
jgi:hypothetical protein